ncbi:exodeoxyribonuclease III [Taylorella equigenitalis]|uniref:exodeoxyribonuclease III n=1 Tax=Taylorella equigenitalis TaxID=29575 RepID=UPI00041CB385|nr:exodeoxyribonuclease III [Taylorella equigenitalis]WDU45703.1 exodeoxyribonuclease III [Taylorella equigenitalis]
MATLTVASWNVNSLNVRLDQVLDWLREFDVDLLCLQELKMESQKIDSSLFDSIGYGIYALGQKTYNGVALISKHPITDLVENLPNYEDPQKRLLAGTLSIDKKQVRIVNVYCPNGSDLESPKFSYKMEWFSALRTYIEDQLNTNENLILTGDFNIAPKDEDIHPKYLGPILISPQERAHFEALLDLGLVDTFRLFEQKQNSFSWWDYRQFGFKRNAGLRIDHILASSSLGKKCYKSWIDKKQRAHERPSDHAPVLAEFKL